MIQKDTKSFIKKNQKTIILVTVILGILYFGFPYFTQSGYDMSRVLDVTTPSDVDANIGDFVDLSWIRNDGYWPDDYYGYMIYVDGVPVFSEVSAFEYSNIIQFKEIGSFNIISRY